MKILLVGVNSKFIHTNLAIRYLKVNCSLPVTTIEFTIKDSQNLILDSLLKKQPDIIAFSVYIWNVEIITNLLKEIKLLNKNIKIILGGPEVSYEYDNYLKNHLANYIISNEGEIAFNLLVNALYNKTSLKEINNLSYYINNKIYRNQRKEISNLDNLKNPYHLDDEDIVNKIQYVELSRGCPFNCAYCLASLEKQVRFFNLTRVKKDILYLYSKGAKTFKFLDRTFNLKPQKAKELFKFVIENDFSNAVFQFEINGDILSEEIIDYLNKNTPINRIRFEIGIQSVHRKVNEAVSRLQDNKKLFDNILKLKKGNVILHLDLIAGLPYEDYNSFKVTFNTVFKLYGDELQLGFLKLLKGTSLYYNQKIHDYKIHKIAPYELIKNKYLSETDIKNIHIVEEIVKIYWNKGFMNNSLCQLTKNIKSPFDFFFSLGQLYLTKRASFHRYQLSDIFEILEEFVNDSNSIDNIRLDYLQYHKIKPKIYWSNKIKKNEIIRKFHSENQTYNLDQLYKYSIVTKFKQNYLLTIYFPNKIEFHKVKA